MNRNGNLGEYCCQKFLCGGLSVTPGNTDANKFGVKRAPPAGYLVEGAQRIVHREQNSAPVYLPSQFLKPITQDERGNRTTLSGMVNVFVTVGTFTRERNKERSGRSPA